MHYTMGLDIGIASVGWSVLANDLQGEPFKIINLGVRIFDAAEKSDTGASLAKPRREARSARRRIRRRKHRKMRIRQLLVSQNVIDQCALDTLFDNTHNQTNIYTLRQQGLDRMLTDVEWVRVLLHLAQRRGYRSNSKAAESKDKENGVLKQALVANMQLMQTKEYRTVGELFCLDAKFSATMPDGTHWRKTRNHEGDYTFTATREMVADEVRCLFDAQRKYENPFANTELEESYTAILLSQRSFDEGPCGDSPYHKNDLRGLCTFKRETGQLRAYKSTYTFSYFRLLTDINHIRICSDTHEPISLTQDQRQTVVTLCMKSEKLDYTRLRKVLGLSDSQYFNRVRYGKMTAEDAEKNQKFNRMKSYHEIRKAL